jgi:VWFA-related protein
MIGWRSTLLLLVMVGGAFTWASEDTNSAQPSSAASGSKQSATTPVFKATTRLVIVNVVVTDKNNHPLAGLKPSDFKLWDSGKPQKLSAFEAHNYAAPAQANPIALPPHQYTNLTSVNANAKSPALNVVLFDLLNSPKLDRVVARKELLKFLTKLPPGHPMALFVLSNRLRLVQGFTESSDSLIAAAKELIENSTPQVDGDKLRSDAEELAAYAARMDRGAAMAAPRLAQALNFEDSYDAGVQAGITVDAIGALGRALDGYPGRKNVLWLSANFPLWLNADMSLPDAHRQTRDYQSAAYALGPMLASSQVAIYPIDIHGMSTFSLDASSTGEGAMGPGFNRALAAGLSRNWDRQDVMSDLARETGGEAFFNMNDLSGIMARTIDAGGNYYTLAYAPVDRKWDGRYRPIKVQVSRPDVKLTYRRGYLAVPEQQVAGQDAQAMLSHAMQAGMPPSTMLMMRVQVLPPDHEHEKVRIDYAVDAHDIQFEDTPDHRKRAFVEFIAIAWSKDNHGAGNALGSTEVTYSQEEYKEFLQTGFPAHQELKLDPGNYVLRLGVMDRSNQKIGTLEVPLTIAAESLGK